MTKKLFAFDIDGTLLNSKGEILPSTIEALHLLQAQGHEITLATGRSYLFIEDILKQFPFPHYLLMNGAAGFLSGKQVIKKTIPKEDLIQLKHFFEKEQVNMAFQTVTDIYRSLKDHTVNIETAMASFRQNIPHYSPDIHLNEEIYQSIAFFSEDLADKITESNYPHVDFVRWHPLGVDIVLKGNSKVVGLLEMGKKLNIAPENIVAFGDGINDTQMIEGVGLGIAMGNAVEPLKKLANYVTTTNDNDGIVTALKHFQFI